MHSTSLLLPDLLLQSLQTGAHKQANLALACLPVCLQPHRQDGIDGTDRQRAEWWIKNLSQLLRKKPDTFPTQPNSLQGTTYLSLPVCTYLFTAVSLIRAVSLSLSLTAWHCVCCYSCLPLYCAVCVCVRVCVTVVYAEKLTHQLIEATQHRL